MSVDTHNSATAHQAKPLPNDFCWIKNEGYSDQEVLKTQKDRFLCPSYWIGKESVHKIH